MAKRNISNSVQLGASINDMAYKNKASLPNQDDVDAQLFADIGKNFSAPGGRPRGFWANLGAGAAKGLEYGAKSQSVGKKQEDYDKYEKVMNYFQEANNAVVEQNQWYQKREGARKELMPQVLAYMDNIERLDPQSQRIMAQDMLAQYGDAIGENFKLSSIDGSNPFLMTIQSDKGQQLFDLRSLFAGDEAVQQSIAMKMPAYQLKLQQERDDKDREFELKESALKARYPSLNSNQAGSDDYGSIPLENIKKGGGGRSFMNTINAEMNLAKDIPVILDQMAEAESIIQSNPAVGQAWNNWASGGDIKKGLMSDKARIAYEKLDKIASRVEEAFIRAKGASITDSERETIKKGLFKTTNLGESNKYNIDSIRKELKIAQERGEFAADELVKGRIATPQSFRKFKESLQMPKNLVTIFDPETGEKQRISQEHLDSAVNAGWELDQ